MNARFMWEFSSSTQVGSLTEAELTVDPGSSSFTSLVLGAASTLSSYRVPMV